MYLLYGNPNWYEDQRDKPEREPLARFTTKEKAKAFAESCILEKCPSGDFRFRRNSLLGGCRSYEIEVETVTEFPFDPEPLTNQPPMEYIVVVKEKDGRITRINCGVKRESVEKELSYYDRSGFDVSVETRFV